jgi:hypothetical protein
MVPVYDTTNYHIGDMGATTNGLNICLLRYYKNRVLTAAEVYQNYEAERWRYQDDGLILELDMAEQGTPLDKSLNQAPILVCSCTNEATSAGANTKKNDGAQQIAMANTALTRVPNDQMTI